MGIPITPPFYYLMSMPVAQVELMAIDQSIIVYPKTDEIEMGDGKKRVFSRPTRDDLDETNRWWQAELERKRKNNH